MSGHSDITGGDRIDPSPALAADREAAHAAEADDIRRAGEAEAHRAANVALCEEVERLRAERDAYRAVVERLLAAGVGNGLSYSECSSAYDLADQVYRVIHRTGGASPEMIRGAARLPEREAS